MFEELLPYGTEVKVKADIKKKSKQRDDFQLMKPNPGFYQGFFTFNFKGLSINFQTGPNATIGFILQTLLCIFAIHLCNDYPFQGYLYD